MQIQCIIEYNQIKKYITYIENTFFQIMKGSLIETTDYMTMQAKQMIKDDDMENRDMMKIHFLIK